MEGIISKRADLPYRSGRYGDWIKSKCIATDEFVIAGYFDSNVNSDAVGALLVGYYEGKDFIYAGRVGTGFSQRTGRELWQSLKPLTRPVPPFANPPPSKDVKGVHWLKPKAVAQIEYRAWTATGVPSPRSLQSIARR